VWLLAVLPSLPSSSGLTNIFVAAVVADLIVIPWKYVFVNYVKKPGDRWKFAGPLTTDSIREIREIRG
jgi:hypothetical protein